MIVLQTALAFAVLGFLFSTRKFLLFMNGLTPIQGLIVYYFILFVTLEILAYFGLVIGGVKMASWKQTIGELLIVFAFFIIVDMESFWVQYVVGEDTKKKQDCPVVYTQAEDGATYYFWSTYVTSNPEIARILTFVVTPAVLVVLGLLLTSKQPIRRSLLA